jgi:hypothetical protein
MARHGVAIYSKCARSAHLLTHERTFVCERTNRPLAVHGNVERGLAHVRWPRLAIVRRVLRLAHVRVRLAERGEVRAQDSAHDLAFVGQAVVGLDTPLAQTRTREVGFCARLRGFCGFAFVSGDDPVTVASFAVVAGFCSLMFCLSMYGVRSYVRASAPRVRVPNRLC